MKDKGYKKEETKYNWFQACSLFRLPYLDKVVIEVKYGSKLVTESEWRKLLKEGGIKVNE